MMWWEIAGRIAAYHSDEIISFVRREIKYGKNALEKRKELEKTNASVKIVYCTYCGCKLVNTTFCDYCSKEIPKI